MIARQLLFALAASSLAAACSFAPSDPADPTGGGPSEAGQARNVTQLYNDTCAKCHGVNGEGGGAGAHSFNTWGRFDQDNDRIYFDTIKNGRKDMGMEAYGPTLTDREIWALVVHIRELQAKALRAETGSTRPVNGVVKTDLHSYRIEDFVDSGKGLSTPWSIDWLPDGRALVTNRPGVLFVIDKGTLTKVDGIPPSIELGQGGLLEVAPHPDYAKNGWIYLGIADQAKSGNREALTKIVRGKIDFSNGGAKWTAEQTIYEADQKFYSGAGIHFGTEVVFDGKGHIFFSVGERGTNMRAQDPTTPYGKIMRLNEDGSIPSDNPYPGNPMWTLGHRNPQGLVFDLDGNLWDTEHGPRGGDEVNLIQKGHNYGWPVISTSINYNDSPFVLPWPTGDQDFTMHVFRWLPSIGACGLDVCRGKAFAKWKGDLFAGGLAGANVDRLRMKDGEFYDREEILHGMGRVRDVAFGPDGNLYVILNQPDKIIRLVPTD
ncbi:MAG: PQQ-dependent sugar dehydrogenase [Fimbriimonadaceae bacterium]|nr:PQQ-dependent sugar dehydrogenase [Chthonomonadaceae bacterium]MCO5297297.1 PQQ-dependent sugar dehydrogenase [Fimbriimonadaceae bacterium]